MISEYENLLSALYKDSEDTIITEELLMKVFPRLYGAVTEYKYNIEKIYKLTIMLITSRELSRKLNIHDKDICDKSDTIQTYIHTCIMCPTSLRANYFKAMVLLCAKIDIKEFLIKDE